MSHDNKDSSAYKLQKQVKAGSILLHRPLSFFVLHEIEARLNGWTRFSQSGKTGPRGGGPQET